MVRLMSDNDLIGSWWQVNASDFDTTTYSVYLGNAGYHGVESRIRIGEAQNCGRNSDLFFVVGALSAGAIAGIVIGCVFGKLLFSMPFTEPLLIVTARRCSTRMDSYLDLLCAKLCHELYRRSTNHFHSSYSSIWIWHLTSSLWRRLLVNCNNM